MSGEEAPTEEFWIYAGLRLNNTKGEARHTWTTTGGDDDLMYFAADKQPYVIGARYRAKVTRGADGTVLHGRPLLDELDAAVPQELLLDWSVRDEATRARLASIRAEKRAARTGSDPVAEALAPLVAQARRLRNRADRDAFVARVVRELVSAW